MIVVIYSTLTHMHLCAEEECRAPRSNYAPMSNNCQTIRTLMVVRPAEGGMKSHVEMLCRELPQFGIELGIGAPAGLHLNLSNPPQFHIVPIKGRTHLFTDSRAARALCHLTPRYDLVHAHGLRAAWTSSLACHKTVCPFVFTAHNLAPRIMGLKRLLLTLTANRAQAVISVSDALALTLARNGIDNKRIRVIPNGIDLAAFDQSLDRNGVRAELGISDD